MKIGNEILKLRKEKDMTQNEFAEIFSVSRQAVSNWENDKSYPDLETIVKISDKFDLSLDKILKGDVDMIKAVDRNKRIVGEIKYIIMIFVIVIIGFGIYLGICSYQHKIMYDQVFSAGFKKEITPEFIEKYQGYYALTENDVDFLVEPKGIGKFSLDTKKFGLVARKGVEDITIRISEKGQIVLALYPGNIIVDKEGNIEKGSEKNLTKEQQEKFEELLDIRRKETIGIIQEAYKKWEEINK